MYYPKYFTLSEFVRSDTAASLCISNVPTFENVENLARLCELVLDPVRKQLGTPITVTSGFRCPALNKRVGGVSNSQHLSGLAADLKSKDLSELFEALAENENVDQLLFEDNGHTRWVHVSIAPVGKQPRNYINRNYKAYIK